MSRGRLGGALCSCAVLLHASILPGALHCLSPAPLPLESCNGGGPPPWKGVAAALR